MKPQNLLTSIFLLPFVGIMGLLTGCGGGGGGSTTTSFVKWSAIRPPATVTASGISTEVGFTVSGSTVDSLTDHGTSNGSSASISYRDDGSISKISIDTPNGSVVWDERSGDSIDDTNILVVAAKQDLSAVGYAVNATYPGVPWEYQTYGVWLEADSATSGTFGGISIGAPTAGSAIPTTGTATFDGLLSGWYIDSAGEPYATVGVVGVDANFETRQLGFSSTTDSAFNLNTQTYHPNPSNLDMTGTLTYDPGINSFSGTVTAAGDTGLSGTSTGQFYGPNAEELGGVFNLSGAGVEFYSGAYGAAQVPSP